MIKDLDGFEYEKLYEYDVQVYSEEVTLKEAAAN